MDESGASFHSHIYSVRGFYVYSCPGVPTLTAWSPQATLPARLQRAPRGTFGAVGPGAAKWHLDVVDPLDPLDWERPWVIDPGWVRCPGGPLRPSKPL